MEDIKEMITKEMIIKAQEEWANALLTVSQLHVDGKDMKVYAEHIIDTLYDFEDGGVLFKPTRASKYPFRNTKEEALSYFICGSIEEDQGFALQPFENIIFSNAHMRFDGNQAFVIGTYMFELKTGTSYTADYTIGYVLKNNQLKIFLHHSSFTYIP